MKAVDKHQWKGLHLFCHWYKKYVYYIRKWSRNAEGLSQSLRPVISFFSKQIKQKKKKDTKFNDLSVVISLICLNTGNWWL